MNPGEDDLSNFSDAIFFNVVFLEIMHLTGGYCNNNVFLCCVSLFCCFIS